MRLEDWRWVDLKIKGKGEGDDKISSFDKKEDIVTNCIYKCSRDLINKIRKYRRYILNHGAY